MQVIYKSSETRSKQTEIQKAVRDGLVLEIVNKTTKEKSFMMNEKITERLLSVIPLKYSMEYDDDLSVYTYSCLSLPALFGEGKTKADAKEAIVTEAIELAEDHVNDPTIFSGILDELQQFVMANIALAGTERERVKEILKLG